MKNVTNTCTKAFKSLCSPAQLYFVLSALSFIMILLQNCGDSSSYQIGTIKVKPECGKTLIWPAEWTHAHYGSILKKNEKYIITGWIDIKV